MTNDQIEAALSQLMAAYPSQAEKMTTDTFGLWREAFASEGDADLVMEAIHDWIDREEFWPSIAGLREIMRGLRSDRRTEQLADRIHCDGSGWITVGGEEEPCPACNPAMRRIFGDPRLLAEYRDGRPIHRILKMKRDELRELHGRPRCVPPLGELENVVHPRTGREIALAAIRSSGREPTKHERAMLERVG